MANTALMEDTAVKREERREDRRMSAEEEHKKNIAGYRALLYENGNAEEWANAGAHESAFEHRASSSYPSAESAYANGFASARYAGGYAPAPTAGPVATATLERPVAPVQQPSAPAAPAAMPVHESVARSASAVPATPAREADFSANTAHRLADYVAYTPAPSKPRLFEGLAIKDGEIIDTRAGAAAPAAAPAPTVMGAPAASPARAPAQMYAAPAVMPAPAFAPAPVEMPAAPAFAPAAEEDALPTRRTMEVLRTSEGTRTQSQSALSAKTKLILCAIVAAVVLIIALICVNSGILSARNADIAGKAAQLQELRERYVQMQDDINYLQSDEYIDAWAQENGMVRGD